MGGGWCRRRAAGLGFGSRKGAAEHVVRDTVIDMTGCRSCVKLAGGCAFLAGNLFVVPW